MGSSLIDQEDVVGRKLQEGYICYCVSNWLKDRGGYYVSHLG